MILALLVGAALADPGQVVAAARAELDRAMTGLRLTDQPPPYWIGVEVLDGQVATAEASMGALMSEDVSPHRMLRAEVRVGSAEFDNGNFDGSWGTRGGTVNRSLPTEDVDAALRREMWLALDEAYKGATESYASKKAAREGSDRPHPADLAPAAPWVSDALPMPAVDGATVQEWVTTLSGVLAGYPQLEEGDAIARDWQGVRLLLNSEGTTAWLPTGFTVVRVSAVLRLPDGSRLTDARSWVVSDPSKLPSIDEMSAEVTAMADWLVGLEQAPTEEDYLGPVIFEQVAAVELFRQLLAPEIAGTPPVERAPDAFGPPPETPPTARVGRRLLPEGWEVTDDPTALSGVPGAYARDYEGVEAQPVALVEDGVLKDVLMSRVPRKDHPASNGHGRSLGADRREGLPAVVFVTPRRAATDRRLQRRALHLAREAGLPYVLVVKQMTPPALAQEFEIAFSGDRPLSGLTPPYEVERLYPDGHRQPVRGLSFSAVDRRVLRDIAMAGRVGDPVGELDATPDRSRFAIGALGGMPVTWVVPSVVVTEMELTGQSGGEPRVIPRPPVAKQ